MIALTVAKMFRVLEINEFPPFGTLKITFPPVPDKPADLAEVHLLTGVNGTGKTRILCALAALLGNFEPLRKRLLDQTSFTINIGENPDTPAAGWPGSMNVTQNAPHWTRRHQPIQWIDKIPAFAY